MIDQDKAQEDRFHVISTTRTEINNPLKVSYGKTPKNAITSTPGEVVTFLPLPPQVAKIKSQGYEFTEDKNYTVLEKREVGKNTTLKIVDDSGEERWIKDEYFVPAANYLMHDKDCGFTRKEEPTSNLVFFGPQNESDVPALRKEKTSFSPVYESWPNSEEDVPDKVENMSQHAADDLEDDIDMPDLMLIRKENTSFCEKTWDFPDLKILAGVKNHIETEIGELTDIKRCKLSKKAKKFFEENSAMPSANFPGENPLLNNLEKLWEKIGTVFPEYRKVDTDGLMIYIRSKMPNRAIEWKNGVLTVDDARTNILKTDVNVAFDGLKKLTTPKMADKLLGKVIVNKLKKLF